jgi:small-conductance mechanosensitive channel
LPTDSQDVVHVFGIPLVGMSAENGGKLLLTLGFVVGVVVLSKILRWLASLAERGEQSGRLVFWTRQGVSLVTAVIVICGVLSIWFNDPKQLTSVLGWVAAGLAVALQRVVTAVAAYFVILRGRTFTVGDRIAMAGVRGDVIALGFMQTRIMEMGQPPGEQADAPSVWVHSRQYSGRIVSVTNDKIFENPVYNYSLEFPFLWEEMSIPIPYKADRSRAEAVLLEVARRHTEDISAIAEADLKELERRYFIRRAELQPQVFYRLTDNWVQMSLRFLVRESGSRTIKDRMSRDILQGFEKAGIEIASGTYDIVGLPPVRVRLEPEAMPRAAE